MDTEATVVENPGLALMGLFTVGLLSSIAVQFVMDGAISGVSAALFALGFTAAYGAYVLVRRRMAD